MSAMPLMLDVDTGVDDAVALALAVASSEIDLIGVSTLAGNVGVERTTENTRAVLDFLGATNVPVYRGASRPLVRPTIDAAYFHGESGLGTAEFPTTSRKAEARKGPAAIVHEAVTRPGEVTLVAVGPLTNVAIALNVQPDLPKLLKRLVIMGGAYRVPGNTKPWAEFNILADPEAAAQVFAADWNDCLAVGLDVSQQVEVTRDLWERNRSAEQPGASVLARVAAQTFLERPQYRFYLHDPLALAVGVDPTLVTRERGRATVDVGNETPGHTTFVPGDGNVDIAAAVDAERFLRLFNERIGIT
jgi:inosine-uridine nucleoside N-ribohydrolase